MLRLEHVPHLVDEEQDDEADAEPPASVPHVERGRHEDREEELELEQDAAELDDERADRREGSQQPSEQAEARLVPYGLGRLGRNAKLPSSVVPTQRGNRGLTGPQGPAGPPGAQGPAGPPGAAGPGAAKINFDAPANTPVTTILTYGGLILRAACSSAGD